ncbi:hypothetical protein C7B61_10705 [filamentous cyanobacterium CCP1]|nr:hypothetical protein C7B61_10705 [filamentous cyanobacterium CCP1]
MEINVKRAFVQRMDENTMLRAIISLCHTPLLHHQFQIHQQDKGSGDSVQSVFQRSGMQPHCVLMVHQTKVFVQRIGKGMILLASTLYCHMIQIH